MDFGLSSKINILENSQVHYHVCFEMVLLRYFKPTKALMALTLPLPSGSLSEAMILPIKVKSIILESSENDAAPAQWP